MFAWGQESGYRRDVQPPIADYVFAGGSEMNGYWGLPSLWLTVQRTAERLARKEAVACGEAPEDDAPSRCG